MIKIKFTKPEGPKQPRVYWFYFWAGLFCTMVIPAFIGMHYGDTWQVQLTGMSIWFFLLMWALTGMHKHDVRRKK